MAYHIATSCLYIYKKNIDMKSNLILILFVFANLTSFSQVGIGTVSPYQNAVLDLVSTSKGFLFPRMTYLEKNAISATVGMMVYQTNAFGGNLAGVYIYDGSIWKRLARFDELGGGGGGSLGWTITGDNQYSNVTGNVGIGTDNPTSKFHLYGNMNIDAALNPIIQFKNAGIDKGFVQLSSNNIRMGTNGGNALGKFIIRTDGADRIFVDSSGNLGIGVQNPLYKLDLFGSSNFVGSVNVKPQDNQFGDNANIDIYANPEHPNDVFGSAFINFLNWQDAGGGNYTFSRKYNIEFDGGTAERLSINHVDHNNQLVLSKNGEIGIGIAPSSDKLEVRGDIRMYDVLPILKLQTDDAMATSNGMIEFNLSSGTNSAKIGTQFGALKLSGRTNATNTIYDDLVIDNNNIGINNANPITKLHIIGGQDANLNSSSNGYIMNGLSSSTNLILDNNEILARNGISPSTLYLQQEGGNMFVGAASSFYQAATINANGEVLKLNGADPNIGFYQNGTYKSFIQQNGNDLWIGNNASDIKLTCVDDVIVDVTNDLLINTGGQVVIGTKNNNAFDYKLTVDGKMICEELKVELIDFWPDYVFEKEYKKLSIPELERYIEKNKHLPNIPSATDVKLNGIELGSMNKLLLEKIEELTLYIIELEKRINVIETKNN